MTMSEERTSYWRVILPVGRRSKHEEWYRLGKLAGLPGFDAQRIELENENLRGARNWSLPGARLVNCDLSYSEFGFCGFEDAEFTDCKFGEAGLGGSHFNRGTVERCSFDNASMQVVHFEEALIKNCSFEKADLLHSSWDRAKVTGTCFVDTLLTNADLSALFEDCSFRGADLRRTWDHLGQTKDGVFTRCDFTGADFDNRPLAGVTFDHCTFADLRGTPIADHTTRIIDPIVIGTEPAWISQTQR